MSSAIADTIVSEIMDLIETDGGLIKSRAVERVEMLLQRPAPAREGPTGAQGMPGVIGIDVGLGDGGGSGVWTFAPAWTLGKSQQISEWTFTETEPEDGQSKR